MKNTLLLVALLLPSFSSIQMAWSEDRPESAEECYKLIEKFVNGSQKYESKDWFFHFQDHHTMKYAEFDSSTTPPTQYWNFEPKNRPGKEQVTMQIFEGQNLASQASVPEKEKVVRRYVIAHIFCKQETTEKDQNKVQKTVQKNIEKCVPESYKKTIFDIQNPASKNCFKTIQSANQYSTNPEGVYSSSFCQNWDSFSAKNKNENRDELYEKFRKENPGWKNEFNEFAHPASTGLLKRVIANCKAWTASDSAAWDASKLPPYQKPSATTAPGGK
jgi:hypothetical protein